MAELALLGLVANIFQFVETGIKIASTARDLYQCAESFQARDIRLLLEEIKSTSAEVANIPPGALSGDELAICEYSAECASIVAELEALAAKITKSGSAKSKALDSMRIAYHNVTKKNEIQELMKRLNEMDQRLKVRLQRILTRHTNEEHKHQWSGIMSTVERLEQAAGRLEVGNAVSLKASAQILQSQLRTETSLGVLFGRLANEIRSKRYYLNLLDSLLFQDIVQRYSDVSFAHTATFNWAFNDGHTGLSKWLESGDGTYWVHGLAGSGKSTLMKYLYGHLNTASLLRRWAGDRKLVTANFFFWALGTRMQKSQLGLLQSLLFQLLRADSVLATKLFPDRRHSEPWTVQELREAFKLVPEFAGDGTRYCFFIDGLDEYEGSETDIISTVSELLNSPNIKICLSSRPWNRFREAYAECPGLTLEDLTKTDILESQEPFEHLQRRVAELPPSLDEFFQRIFDRIDAIYRQQTARLFLVALYLEEHDDYSLPLMAYNCLEAEVRDPSYVSKQRLLARDKDWIQHLPETVSES
ncbi:hypothetical protein PG990_011716 [Apiospora arundinis]